MVETQEIVVGALVGSLLWFVTRQIPINPVSAISDGLKGFQKKQQGALNVIAQAKSK